MKISLDIPPPLDPGGYSVSQAARLIGVSRRTIERLAQAGKIEMTPKSPGFIARITEQSLRKFLRGKS